MMLTTDQKILDTAQKNVGYSSFFFSGGLGLINRGEVTSSSVNIRCFFRANLELNATHYSTSSRFCYNMNGNVCIYIYVY